MNRRWTFILALGISLLISPVSHLAARAATAGASPSGGGIIDPSDPSGGGGGIGAGDPDIPDNKLSRGTATRIQSGSTARTVGDGRVVTNVWKWRLSVALQGLRWFYVRF